MKRLILLCVVALFALWSFSLAQEKLTNGNFESGMTKWALAVQGGAGATFDIDSLHVISVLKVDTSQSRIPLTSVIIYN